jgi:pyruvate dehydrogenase E2 component (dihydrolipoamide acetyltransferase)
MPVNVLMPALSPTMEKGNLAKWLKKEGDTIKSGDVIAEIETDKATMEVEAVDEGILARIVVPAGTADVPVNDLIAVIAGEGEDPKAVASGGGAAPAPKSPQNATDVVTAAAPPAAAASAAAPQAQAQAAPAQAAPAQAAPFMAGAGGRARVRLAARQAHRQGRRHRSRPGHRVRPAWPRRGA